MILSLRKKYQRIIAYLIWGVITTLVNIGVFMLWYRAGGNYQIGTILAWFLSILVAFFSNKVWVFNSHYTGVTDTLRELIAFFSARLITLVIDIIITWLGISFLHGNVLVVKIIDNIVVVLANYTFSKRLVFRSR